MLLPLVICLGALCFVMMLADQPAFANNSSDFKKTKTHAEQGDAQAQTALGVMYAFGQGVSKNYKQAAYWYHKAANQSDANAQFLLAVMYELGQGVPQDDKQAVYWYRKAAEQGITEAQFYLGWMYARGQGVPQDYVQAHMWLNLAAVQGHEKARKLRNLLDKRMSPDQLAEAQRLAVVAK